MKLLIKRGWSQKNQSGNWFDSTYCDLYVYGFSFRNSELGAKERFSCKRQHDTDKYVPCSSASQSLLEERTPSMELVLNAKTDENRAFISTIHKRDSKRKHLLQLILLNDYKLTFRIISNKNHSKEYKYRFWQEEPTYDIMIL